MLEAISLLLMTIVVLTVVVFLASRLNDRYSFYLIVTITFTKLMIIGLNEIKPIFTIKPDAEFYFRLGVEISKIADWPKIYHLLSSFGGISASGIASYGLFSAFFLSIFGPYRFVMPMVNIGIYAGIVIIVIYYLNKFLKLDIKHFGLYASFILLIYPAALSNSVRNLREMVAILGYVIFILELLLKQERAFKRPLFYFGIGLFVIMRPVSLLVIFANIVFFFIVFKRKGIMLYLIIGLVIVTLLSITFSDKLYRVLTPEIALRMIEEKAEEGSEPFPIEMNYTSIQDLILHVPERMVYFLFYPFPWEVKSYKFLIPTVDAAFNLMLVFLLFIGWIRIRKYTRKTSWLRKHFTYNHIKKSVLFLIGCSLTGIAMYSVLEARFGGAIRHRIPFVIMGILSASIIWFILKVIGKSPRITDFFNQH